MVDLSKQFNGKKYSFLNSFYRKGNAKYTAKQIKAKGNFARVIKAPKYMEEKWLVYRRVEFPLYITVKGRDYTSVGRKKTKLGAQKLAKRYKKKGHKIRIKPREKGFQVFSDMGYGRKK